MGIVENYGTIPQMAKHSFAAKYYIYDGASL